MIDMDDLVDRYVAVWNESDAAVRRQRIRALWAPEGRTCYRLLDAQGYEAIEARVVGSWEKWLQPGSHAFRPVQAAMHHDVVKFDWQMVTMPDAERAAGGLSFLGLDPEGRIDFDYQFNPTANDATELAERYVAMLNEPDAAARRDRVAALWAADGTYASKTAVMYGHDAIAAETAAAEAAHRAEGLRFAPAGCSQAHHNVARFGWRLQSADGGPPVAIGSELLICDDGGRIRFDCRFTEPS